MTSLVLSVVGSALGNAIGGPVMAGLGRALGSGLGKAIDGALFRGPGETIERSQYGPRLNDLDVPATVEGNGLARVFGRAKVAGQIIWATRFEEKVSVTTETTGGGHGGKGGGGGGGGTTVVTHTTTYSYFANVAIALGEGPINRVARIWADGELMDLGGLTWRFHDGDEDQLPDALIQAKEGTQDVPAYRGIAYVVFERLPIGSYGNRLPQFAFEVIRNVGRLENRIEGVCLIPGATEFGYHTTLVRRVDGPGTTTPENRHVLMAGSDVEASLDELQAVAPNIKSVAVVVPWYCDDLRCGVTTVKPGVDAALKTTLGATWSVSGVSRSGAHLVSKSDGRSAYGGTPSDESVVALIRNLKQRGLAVTLIPFLLMDVPAGNTRQDPWTGALSQPTHPWRGRMTVDPAPGRPGTPDETALAVAQVQSFFGTAQVVQFSVSSGAVSYSGPAEWTYRRFVLHLAHLASAAGGIDTMLIGSELRDLVRVRSARRVFPAVNALLALAADVKAVVGAATTVSYAADWTEYGAYVPPNRPDDLLFPLDPLWASSSVGCVGIDAYWPLSDWRDGTSHIDGVATQSPHDRGYLARNMIGGEAFDWYYASKVGRDAQTRLRITDGAYGKPWVFRPKDVAGWWGNAHIERINGVEQLPATAWQAGLKPIRFTEIGFAAVDKATNQPSAFPDPKSSEGGLPAYSTGARDDLIQRRALEVFIDHFDEALPGSTMRNPLSTRDGRRMVDTSRTHVWCWDARPFPMFPVAEDVWSDGAAWHAGHWLNGRLGSAPLDELLPKLSQSYGGPFIEADTSTTVLSGIVIDRVLSGRSVIEPLINAFGLDVVDSGSSLRALARGEKRPVMLDPERFVSIKGQDRPRLVRAEDSALPRALTYVVADPTSDYRRVALTARRSFADTAHTSKVELAVVLAPELAESAAEHALHAAWAGRETVSFTLPPSGLALEPGDTVGFAVDSLPRLFRIERIEDGLARHVEARAVDPLPRTPSRHVRQLGRTLRPVLGGPADITVLDLPDLPGLSIGEKSVMVARATPWPGGYAVRRSNTTEIARLMVPATFGTTDNVLAPGPVWRFDQTTELTVKLRSGVLGSVSRDQVLDGANAAAIEHPDGWEVIQFERALLVGPDTYVLSGILRGQGGTEELASNTLPAGARFVRLDEAVTTLATDLSDIGRPLPLQIIPIRGANDPAAILTYTLTPTGLALKPLAPVGLSARRSASGIEINFIRRTRTNGDNWELLDVPLNEASEAYEVEILQGNVVKRILQSTESKALYASADELADFQTAQSSLSLRVMQISQTIGRGRPAAAVLAI
jgi:hypothetical protein